MDWLSVLPPVVAIAVVLWCREVILALLLSLLTSELLLAFTKAEPVSVASALGTVDRITAVFSSEGNTRVLTFSLLVGALIAFLRHSGGVAAFVDMLINKKITQSKRQAGLLTYFTGLLLFIESNLSILTAGILSRGLFDRFGMSRERLAYIIDSTSAPVCILLLFNAWGAFVLALLSGYEFDNPVSIVFGTIAFNFYAWVALLLVLYTIVTDNVHGPLKHCDLNTQQHTDLEDEFPASKSRFMLVPLTVMIIGIFGFMYWTGNGTLTEGNGSRSILYATITAVSIAYLMMLTSRRFTHIQLIDIGFKGMADLLQLVCIVLFSIALGASLKELGTGVFIAGIAVNSLPVTLIVPMLFLAGSLVAFSTGTSWGTFAILIPIGVPLIQTLGLPPAFVIAAILGGGVFGDHCSPISDTTAVSSIAAGCSLLDHVKTQLPYALVGGAITFVAYWVMSFFIL